MAFTYNNVSPTVIDYKGTDIKVLKYGETAVWGKPYSLSVSAGTGTSVTVNRTASPNQHASTGNLSNGDTIYHGDTLGISYSVNTGYNIATHTINGNTLVSPYLLNSVSENVSISTTATVQTYTLNISAGTGSSVTVNRTSSPYGGGSTGNLSNGAVLYYGDNLTISYSVSTGYNIGTHTVNSTTFNSGATYTVSSNMFVVTTASVITYSLSISQGTGTTITVNRTASSYGGGNTGNLANNATLYYGDSLTISYSTGAAYNIGVHTVNSNTFTSGATYTVSSNISVVTTASVKTYQLSISAGSNTSVTVNRTASSYGGGSTGNLSNNATLYYGDSLTISYSVSSGYNISTHTVNGTTFTSGSQYTVTSNISVVTTAVVAASWHTVWTGSLNVGNTSTKNPSSAGIDNRTYSISGLRANTRTRVTIYQSRMITWRPSISTATVNQVVETCGGVMYSGGSYMSTQPTLTTFTAQNSSYISTSTNCQCALSIDTPTTDGVLPVHDLYKPSASGTATQYLHVSNCTITSIEQYY